MTARDRFSDSLNREVWKSVPAAGGATTSAWPLDAQQLVEAANALEASAVSSRSDDPGVGRAA
jgi:hypothetical protein